jgi:outer membrane lipoprotein-sorting protein
MSIAVLALQFAMIAGSGYTAAPGTQSNPNAQEILTTMDRTYAEAKSYRDTGVIKTTFFESTRTGRHEVQFSTAYDRPMARFRFEFRNNNAYTTNRETRYIIWQDVDRKDLQLWKSSNGRRPAVEQPKSLPMALAGAAGGGGGGSAYDIPELLFRNLWGTPDTRWGIDGFTLKEMSNPQRIDDSELGGKQMYRVTGTILKTALTVWIDKATFLVHRIERKSEFPDFRVETTATYFPIINSAIPDELLMFNKPH